MAIFVLRESDLKWNKKTKKKNRKENSAPTYKPLPVTEEQLSRHTFCKWPVAAEAFSSFISQLGTSQFK